MKSLARASLVVLTSISLVMAFGATAAQAAATVGKPCARAGMTTVDAQGRNLVCVKVKTGKDNVASLASASQGLSRNEPRSVKVRTQAKP